MSDLKDLEPLADAGLLVYQFEPTRYFIWKPQLDGIDTGGDILFGWPSIPLRKWPQQLSDTTERGAKYLAHYREEYGSDCPVFATVGPKGQLFLADGLCWLKVGFARLGGKDLRPTRSFEAVTAAVNLIIRFYDRTFTSNNPSEEELATLLAGV